MADEISFSAELDTGNFDAGMEILTGALRQVGTIAVDAFMGAAAAAVSFFGDAFSGAMEAETNMARFDAVLNAVTASSEEQAAAFAEASDSVVTGTYLSAEAMVELQSEVDHANAKLHDMEAAYAGAETHTESQTLALEDQRQKVADLAAEVAHGGSTFTTTLAAQMGLVPPVAHLTRDELLALADEYKNLAGGSDDAVIAAEAVLLKFTQIGRETFPEALAVSADLAAFLGVDMASAAQTLGFALDNPGEALARLNKQTGAFTDTEIETIKAMAEAGDVAGAQALILENLTNTVGGTAEALANTTAGQWAIFQETIADTGEGIMSKLLLPLVAFGQEVLPMILPMIEEFGTVLGGLVASIIPVAAAFGEFITDIMTGEDPIGNLANLFYEVANALGLNGGGAFAAIIQLREPFDQFVAFIQTNMPAVQATFATVFAAIQGVFTVLSDFVTVTLMPAIASIWEQSGVQLPTAQQTFEAVMNGIVVATQLVSDFITNILVPTLTAAVDWVVANWPQIQAKIEEVWAMVQPILQAAADFIINTVIPTFAQAVDWVVANWPQIQAKIEEVMAAVQAVVSAVLGELVPFWLANLGQMKDWVDANWPLIQATIETIINNISASIHSVVDPLVAFWNANHETIMAVASAIWENIKLLVSTAITAIGAIITVTMQLITGDWEGAWTTIQTTLTTIWTNMQAVAENSIAAIYAVVSDVLASLKTWWDAKWTEIQNSVTTILASILVTITAAVGNIAAAFDQDWPGLGMAIIGGIQSGIGSAVQGLVDAAVNAAVAAYNAALEALGIGSPSKLFAGLGENVMKSMAGSIEKNSNLPAQAVELASSRLVAPVQSAIQAVTHHTDISRTDARTYNLNATTDRTMQRVQSEFSTMQTLAGA